MKNQLDGVMQQQARPRGIFCGKEIPYSDFGTPSLRAVWFGKPNISGQQQHQRSRF